MYITNGLLIMVHYILRNLLTVNADNFTLITPGQSISVNPHFYTKLSSFGYSVASSTCIILHVKVCRDAHIALMRFNDELLDIYEIVIGGWGNTWSVFCKKKVQGCYNKQYSTLYRKLKIGWRESTITVYRWKTPCQWEVVMTWHDTSYPVNYVGVSTWKFDGKWIIHNESCHETNDNRPTWKKEMLKIGIPMLSPTYSLMDSTSMWRCAAQCQKFDDCCFFKYDGITGKCLGYSFFLSSFSLSEGTSIWKRL